MKYLTRAEYAKLYNITRQAVADKIRRGTLPTVQRKEYAERIAIEDVEYERVKSKHFTA